MRKFRFAKEPLFFSSSLNISKSITFFALFVCLFSLQNDQVFAASSPFRIAPYLILNSKNEYILKFKPRRTTTLNIQYYFKSLEGTSKSFPSISQTYKAYTTYDIKLGRPDCNQTVGFRISAPEDVATILSENELPFVPCEADEDLVLGFLADTQQNAGHSQVAKVIEGLFDENINLILQGGDVVHFGAKIEEWNRHFDVAETYYAKIPVMAAIGNHEYWYSYLRNGTSRLFKTYMRTEEDSPTGELHLSFPQIDLLFFNSNFKWASSSNQFNWLEEKLAALKKKGKKAIVILHHSPFTSGKNRGEGRGATLRSRLVPIVEKYGNVPLVLSGHEHIYERSLKENVHYVVAGPAGGLHYEAVSANPYREYVNDDARTFTLIKISRKGMQIKTYDTRHRVIDEVTVPFN